MDGVVYVLHDGYGFVRGEDGVSRFFLPSALERTGPGFAEMRIGHRVRFTHIDHPRGPRAIEIRIMGQPVAVVDDGEEG